MNRIQWAVSLGRLMFGTAGVIAQARASALDEPITPTNLTVRDISTVGSTNVAPVKIDTAALFVERSKFCMYEVAYDGQKSDFGVKPLMRLHRYLGRGGITQIAVARQPDTRAFAVRGDGQLLALLYDPGDNAIGWSRIVTNGFIESVEAIPGEGYDRVHVVVRRMRGNVAVRTLEEIEVAPPASAAAANMVDGFVRRDDLTAADTHLVGLDHLEGFPADLWVNGAYRGAPVVTGGQVPLPPNTVGSAVAGLYYEGRYTSSRLAYAAQAGTAHAMLKRPVGVAFLLLDALPGALEYGNSFAVMDRLADRDLGTPYDTGPGLVSGETGPKPMPGGFERDPRISLRASSRGGPVTVQGMVLGIQTNEKVG